MTDRPRLYPGHQHQWVHSLHATDMVYCTVCGLQMPRNAAGVDGRMTQPALPDDAHEWGLDDWRAWDASQRHQPEAGDPNR